MYCMNCGHRLEDGTESFCPYCGSRLEEGEAEERGAVIENDGGEHGKKTEKTLGDGRKGTKKKRKIWKVWAAAGAAAAVVVATAASTVFLLNLRETADGTAQESLDTEKEVQETEAKQEPQKTEKGNMPDTNEDTADGALAGENAREEQGTSGVPTGLTTQGKEIYKADFDVSSSSVLQEEGYYYGVDNLSDLDPATCWAEGVAGSGVNENILFTSMEKQTVSGLAILPGFTKSEELYDKNCVPTEIRIEYGSEVMNYSIDPSSVAVGQGNVLDHMIYIDFGEKAEISECKVTIINVREEIQCVFVKNVGRS